MSLPHIRTWTRGSTTHQNLDLRRQDRTGSGETLSFFTQHVLLVQVLYLVGTCTVLEYFHALLLYTPTALHLFENFSYFVDYSLYAALESNIFDLIGSQIRETLTEIIVKLLNI